MALTCLKTQSLRLFLFLWVEHFVFFTGNDTSLICLLNNFILFTEPPTPSQNGAANGGGDGIRLGYREGTTGTFTTVTAGQAITLRDGAYDFECAVLNINSVNPLPTSGAPATGTCPSGTSSIARDLVNIFFYFNNDNTPLSGESGNSEPSTYANPPNLYTVTDIYRRTTNRADGCSATLTCRAAYSAAGNPTASATASPFITVSIRYEGEFRFGCCWS